MVENNMLLGEIGESFTAAAINWIRTLGLLGVFLGVIIESVIIPIPSPLIMMGAGFILISPELSFVEALFPLFTIALVGALASTLGAYIAYGIGFFGGRPAIQKYKWIFGVSWEEVELINSRYEKRHSEVIFSLRAIPIIPLSVISFIFGICRIKWTKFTFWTFLGTLPRCFILASFGWFVGKTYDTLAQTIDFIETLTLVLIVVLIVAYIIYKKKFSDRLIHTIEEHV
jgi:membrane protein DedA with SNARE-associated domain